MFVLQPSPSLARLLLLGLVLAIPLAASAVAVQLAGTGGIVGRTFVDFFHPDREHSVLSWFQSLQLLLCGGLAWTVMQRGASGSAGHRIAWTALACGFVFLSLDEAAVIHERLEVVVPAAWRTGPLRFAWVVPALAMLVALAPCFRSLLRDLPTAHRRRLLAAAGVYLGGAVGMEMVDGAVQSTHGAGTAYWTLVVVEEALEMTGQWLAVRAFARIVVEPAVEPPEVAAAAAG